MDLRDGLIAVGIVVLLVIAVDGIRRMRNRGKIKLAIDKQFENLPEEDLSAELPNGGARPARQHSSSEGEVDLLMDENFQGVTAVEEPIAAAKAKAPVFKYQHERVEPTVLAEEDALSQPAVDQPVSERIEPDFSEPLSSASSDVDILAEDESLLDENHRDSGTIESSTSALETETYDDGIISPVRVRKVVSSSAGGNPHAELDSSVEDQRITPDYSADEALIEPSSMIQDIPQDEPAEAVAPKVVLAAPADSEPDFDFNRPVTELMADKLPPMPVNESSTSFAVEDDNSVVEDKVAGKAETAPEEVTTAEQPAPVTSPQSTPTRSDAGLGTQDLLADTPVQTDVDDPLIAERENTNATESVSQTFSSDSFTAGQRSDTAAEAKPEKKKKRKRTSRIQRWKEEIQTSFFDIDPGLDPLAKKEPTTGIDDLAEASVDSSADPLLSAEVEPTTTSEQTPPSEPQVLALMVTASDQQFAGAPLFKLVEACGMEFGEMDIYHRFEDGQGQGAIQFSMVNGVKPGHFDPAQRDQFTTPAVSFFLQMGEPSDLMNAFECMLATAQCVADNLDGDVKDENHSVMRPQTVEHYRQQIRDFERRRLARRA